MLRLLLADAFLDEPAGGDAGEEAVARLAGADEHDQVAAVERHVTLLLPEPKDQSEPLDVEVEFKGSIGR